MWSQAFGPHYISLFGCCSLVSTLHVVIDKSRYGSLLKKKIHWKVRCLGSLVKHTNLCPVKPLSALYWWCWWIWPVTLWWSDVFCLLRWQAAWPWQWSSVTSVISPIQCWLRVAPSPNKRVSLTLINHMWLLPLCLSIVSTKLRFILPPKVNPLQTFTPVSCCSSRSKSNTADCWPEETEVTVCGGGHQSFPLSILLNIFSRCRECVPNYFLHFLQTVMAFFVYQSYCWTSQPSGFTGHKLFVGIVFVSKSKKWKIMVMWQGIK